MERFRELTAEAARDMREGSLYEGDEYPNAQQVHRTSWEYLAKINELGFLTWGSQDALSGLSDEINYKERAYVLGFMPKDRARAFVSRFNLDNDSMMATIVHHLDHTVLVRMIKDREYLGITNYQDDITRGVMPGFGDINLLRHYNLLCGEDILLEIQVIDMKWGRPAPSKKGLWHAVITTLTQVD